MKRPRDECSYNNMTPVATAPVMRHRSRGTAAAVLVVVPLLLWMATSTASTTTEQAHRQGRYLKQQQQQQQQQRNLHHPDQRNHDPLGGNYNHRSYHHHHYYYRSSSSTSYAGGPYGRTQRHARPMYSSLKDVFFCLAMALGWTVWMLSSLARSDWLRYQQESVLVRGHVLEVSIDQDSLGTGIPTYKAIIDYMVDYVPAPNTLNNNSEQCNSDHHTVGNQTIQVRKHFETQHLLQQGFANVELLVLPQEPTHSVLREDYEQQIEEQTKGDTDHKFWCQGHVFCKRLSVGFAGVLVMLSLAGCVTVVTKLDPITRWKGWIVLCAGVTLLLPTGLLVYRAVAGLQRMMDSQSQKAGIILRGATTSMRNFWDDLDVLDPRLCNEDVDNMTLASHVRSSRAMGASSSQQYQVQRNLSGMTATADAVDSSAGCYFIQMGGGSRSTYRQRQQHRRMLTTITTNSGGGGALTTGTPDKANDSSNIGSVCSDKTSSTISSLSAPTSSGDRADRDRRRPTRDMSSLT